MGEIEEKASLGSSASDDEEWEYVYEDELEEGDVWEYLTEDEQASNPLSYQNVQAATDDLNALYREGAALARDFSEVVGEVKGMLDFKKMIGL